MKKYTVKFYVVDYVEKEFEVVADNKSAALAIASEKSENGEGDFTLVNWRTWKKPTIKVRK